METPYEAGRGYELTQVRVDQFRHDAPCQGDATTAPGATKKPSFSEKLGFWLPARLRTPTLADSPEARAVDSAVPRG